MDHALIRPLSPIRALLSALITLLAARPAQSAEWDAPAHWIKRP